MNNQQFRKLVLDTPGRQAQNGSVAPAPGSTPSSDAVLGARKRSSIPMTPRALQTGGHHNDFARQLAERQREASGQPAKKFKSSAAPKGSKLASGYVDRAKAREEEEEEDDKATRIKNLEEMMKLQQIDRPTFERLRDDIIGGDINAVHLMKGLDFKLLERIRRGEDVLSGKKEVAPGEPEADSDVDDEFEDLEHKEIAPVQKEEKKKKHGTMAAPSKLLGGKRTRDMILAEMKAAREAAKAKAGPTLGAKFKKVGAPKETSRIERDSKGREVLITVDHYGNEKRKVRKIAVDEQLAQPKGHGLLMPDVNAAPLGMIVPEAPKPPPEEDEDFDIFDDAGDDYDPLAGLADEDDSASDKEDGELDDSKPETVAEKKESKDKLDMPPPPRPFAPPSKPRNYFGDTMSAPDEEDKKKPAALRDPNFMAALKKASQIAAHAKAEKSKEEAEREAKLKRMLESQDRDAADMDMGFGSSRLADEEDLEDEGKIKLSNWGEDDKSDDEGKGKKGEKRKRGGKKKQG